MARFSTSRNAVSAARAASRTAQHYKQRPRLNLADAVMTGLGLVSGPGLLWATHRLITTSSASSTLVQVENILGLLCALIGWIMVMLWAFYLLISAFVIICHHLARPRLAVGGLRLLPGSLRRIVVAAFGIQLALASAAFASPTATTPTSPDIDGWVPSLNFTEEHHAHSPSPAASPHQNPSSDSTAATATVTTAQPTSTADPGASQQSSASIETHPIPALHFTAVEGSLPLADLNVFSPQHSELQRPSVSEDTSRLSLPLAQRVVEDKPDSSAIIFSAETAVDSDETGSVRQTVTVLRGDTLWDLAREELGSDGSDLQVDARWRTWWLHNRKVIGDDPHLLKPGQILEVPPWTQEYSELP